MYLWSIVRKHPIAPHYIVQDIVEKFPRTDVKLIILPVHHPELNPIELIWSQIKQHVRANNIELKQGPAEALVKEKVAQLKQEQWQACMRHVQKAEDMYNKMTQMQDDDELDGECEVEDEE